MSAPADLRSRAEALADPLPPLLASAEQLAATVALGQHGRRRAGLGDSFWQYRPSHQSDASTRIDWRRSGKTDQTFVQDKEWQIAQSVALWVDRSSAMRHASSDRIPQKAERARLLALALSALLIRGGERVGLTGSTAEGDGLPPRPGEAQLARLANALVGEESAEYGLPGQEGLPPHSRAVFLSDFLGDPAPLEAAIAQAADRGIRGAFLQILDPEEESFPFRGRTIFESGAGSLRHETLKADALRQRYLDRLAERKDRLAQLARMSGWLFTTHLTSEPAAPALLWLYTALDQRA
ncbi:DUF58 domain-containing protein [Pseudoroseicyclus tamaricis]|uniref:DUF58 domain-containing protein n=1 Tax=Pseudoroseicyclus tamaricis TaxID=2705421 RepID=A0A6B2JP12_9RHOB|nr:DUF58 domain-containing protein [Pseudoroseicyclus tamaricis]NDU99674.1 DUF58 domain-containing protein [Pseudoroseicyclus tamaricis]